MMPQITHSVNDVIVNSLYLLGELGVGEVPDAFMLSTGVELINEILDKFASDSIYIPYLTTVNFTFTAGKDVYSLSDIAPADVVSNRVIDLFLANYTVQPGASEPIIYPLIIMNKTEYYAHVRLSNLLARPGFVFLNKQPTQSLLTFYPVPDQPYPCQLQLKVMLNSLGPQDLLTELPPNYYGFLKYALARKFKSYYPSGNWTQEAEEEYMDYYMTLKETNETDLTIRPSVILDAPQPFYWPNILAY